MGRAVAKPIYYEINKKIIMDRGKLIAVITGAIYTLIAIAYLVIL